MKKSLYYVSFIHINEIVEFKSVDSENAVITGHRIAAKRGTAPFVIALSPNHQKSNPNN